MKQIKRISIYLCVGWLWWPVIAGAAETKLPDPLPIETMRAAVYNDLLDGGAGPDVLKGGDGADYLFGGGSLMPTVTDQQLADPDGPAWGVTDINGQPGLANVGGLSDIEGSGVHLLLAGREVANMAAWRQTT